jgi:hypothetical protein
LDLESNRRALHGDYLADQLHEVCDRAALFAGVDAEKSLLLFLRGPLIYVDDNAPVTLQDISRDVCRDPQSEARYIHAIDLSLFEMTRQCRIAGSSIRVNADPARTEHLAITDFEKTAFEFVGHIDFPLSKHIGK